MNWLDVTLIIIGILLIIGSISALIGGIKDGDIAIGITVFVCGMFLIFFISIMPFMVIDKASGITIGEITSVDRNFFGTTALFIKVNEATQEEVCIENKELAKKAYNLIGKRVKVTYGTRVGMYSTGKCYEAPIKSIELVKE